MTDASFQPLYPGPRRDALSDWWNSIDRTALGWIAALMLAGVLLSFGSSPAATERMGIENDYYFVSRHAVFAVLAVTVLGLCSSLDPRGVRRLAGVLFVGALALMAYILVAGHEAKGAQRWIRIASFTFQPSELLKPAVVVLVAWLFAERTRNPALPVPLLALGFWLVPILFLVAQPDVGQSVLITISLLAVFFFAGMPVAWIGLLFAVAVVGAVGLYFLLPHMAVRVNDFINAADGPAYQVGKALDAISAGGVFGRGPGEGVVKYGLPDGHTDFIYAVASEEFGLLAGLSLIVCFAAVVIRGLSAAAKLTDPFRQIAAAGLYTLFGFQAAINLAVNLHLVPPKGMTLPLISYGGTSLLGTAVTLGLALALTRRRGA
jgi:cell division protein FtsW